MSQFAVPPVIESLICPFGKTKLMDGGGCLFQRRSLVARLCRAPLGPWGRLCTQGRGGGPWGKGVASRRLPTHTGPPRRADRRSAAPRTPLAREGPRLRGRGPSGLRVQLRALQYLRAVLAPPPPHSSTASPNSPRSSGFLRPKCFGFLRRNPNPKKVSLNPSEPPHRPCPTPASDRRR